MPQPHCSMMSCLGVPVIRLWDSQPCPPSPSLSPQVHLQPVWVMGAQQATHHANILPWLLLLGLGQSPILVLSVERGFHSNIRWKHTIESTQVWAPGMCKLSASLQALVCPPLSPSLYARFSHNSFAQPSPPSIFHQPYPLPSLGEKPFSCSLCPQRSRDFSAMTKHLRTHGAAPYRCPLCSAGCPSLASMQAHMRGHSPSQLPPGWTIRSTFLYSSSSRPSRASTSPL